MKKEEEAALKKQLGKKEAKAEAERRLQQRYMAIEQQVTIKCSQNFLQMRKDFYSLTLK